MVLLVTCLLHKQEALTSDLQPPCTRSDAHAQGRMQRPACNPKRAGTAKADTTLELTS